MHTACLIRLFTLDVVDWKISSSSKYVSSSVPHKTPGIASNVLRL